MALYGHSKTHIDRTSLGLVISKVGQSKANIRLAFDNAIKVGGERWRTIALEAVSATDHTLPELAAMDHPYARRHGGLTLHAGPSRYMEDGAQTVHSQSGAMARALRSAFIPGRRGDPAFRVWLDRSVPEVDFVLGGTRTMLPRDPLGSAARAPGTQSEIKKAIVNRLRRRFGNTVQPRFT